MPEKTIEQTILFTRMVAAKQNWLVNPDKDFADSLVEGLTVNFNRYGYYLCPCRDTEGSRERDADVLCPCKYSWPDIEEHGHCYCALFLSKKFVESGAEASGIADRRGS